MIKNSEAIPCRLDALVVPPLFSCIVVDPPWEIKFGEDKNRDKRASTGSPKGTWSKPNMDYNTMTLEEISNLPVGQLAEKNSHLYLWTINKYIEQSYVVARAWGFSPSCLLTWAKTPRGLGLGGTFVQTTEHILFCRKGKNTATGRIVSTWWNWKRPEKITGPKHSRKPDEFQDMIETISPGPYLELFARQKRPGWFSWGNEVTNDICL